MSQSMWGLDDCFDGLGITVDCLNDPLKEDMRAKVLMVSVADSYYFCLFCFGSLLLLTYLLDIAKLVGWGGLTPFSKSSSSMIVRGTKDIILLTSILLNGASSLVSSVRGYKSFLVYIVSNSSSTRRMLRSNSSSIVA